MADPLNTPIMLLKNGLRLNTPGSGGAPTGRLVARRLLQDTDVENDPPTSLSSPSKFAIIRQAMRLRGPLEDHDANSRDSGISEDSKSSSEFRFVEPQGAAPKRMSSMDISPLRLTSPRRMDLSPRQGPSPRRNLSFSSYPSDASSDSVDDGFIELFNPDKMDEDAQMGNGMLGNLLSARILTGTPPKSPGRPSPRNIFKRSMSLAENSTPLRSEELGMKRRLNLDETHPQKKHRPLAESQDGNTGERGTLFQYGFRVVPPTDCLPSPPLSITPSPPEAPRTRPPLLHSTSDSALLIKLALQNASESELIGDMTRPFALPLVSGQHQDLKTISCDTLAKLMNGEFMDTVSSYKIIDCRYPYEYEGGHIKGAVNLYTRDQISVDLMGSAVPSSGKDELRNILVFHCEYSSERGPCLFRWLRKEDRSRNPYPQLTYPELYLLHGGYNAFYKSHSELCEPRSYKPMGAPEHVNDLKHFRAKSKSWAGKHNKKMTMRNLSRLGF